MIVSLALFVAALCLVVMWTGEKWLLWLLVGVAAILAQVALYLGDYLSRFRVGRKWPTAESSMEYVQSCEASWRKSVGEVPIVLLAFGLLGWLGRSHPRLGVPLQIGLVLFGWAGVFMGWITGMRFRRMLGLR